MNERIKELAEQAGMVMYPTGLGISENTLWGDKNISKFAELIVRECADAIIKDSRLSDVRSAANGCVRAINEHFGVET